MEEPKSIRTKKSNKLQEIKDADSNPFGAMVSKPSGSVGVSSSSKPKNNLPQMTFDLGITQPSGPSVNECSNDAAR